MDMHKKSLGVQEWGIRALYSQCLLSANAESNKISLASSGHDGGPGMDVIHRAMETAKFDVVTIELACRLYWCLSSSEDIAKTLSTSTDPIYGIMNAVHLYRKRPEAAAMTEAAYGALANLARITDKNHGSLRDSGVITAAMESIGAFHYDEELYVEACALLSNMAQNPANKEEILNFDAVSIISRLMHHYSHNATLQEEALNALLSLSADSVRAKMSMISESTFGSVIRLLEDRKSPTTMQELSCSLLCSLSVQKEGADLAVSQGAVQAVLTVMKTSSGERRVQEAASMTLRNFACQRAGIEQLLAIDAVQTLVGTMQGISESETVQLNSCCILWNLVENSKKEPTTIADAGGIEQVVRAMQAHMESGEVLEMACGALWSLIDCSEDRKKSMVGSGAIDAVTCALVMHPNEPHTLEKACGLLANICTQSMMAEAIADSQGISMVVEAMRNNSSSLSLLELGTLVLRNLVLVNPEYALEASNGISTIINAMKDNPEAVEFQTEACNALWALAAQSEDCKSKIVALDGVQILMNALENNHPSEVQDAARGAINQLARSGGGGL
uniref:LRRK2 ARM repeat domain-containing protein n=1 Tax=Cyclophora tenuis TaxID=216820 RepID=A0A7S1D537_CYCTE